MQTIKFTIHILIVSLTLLLTACTKESAPPTVKIAINPWPGYEFLFLAQEKGFFEAQNLDIKLVELPSLADVQRVYVQGRADGMASTMIEAVQAAGLTQEAIAITLIPDYSNGGDVIVSTDSITKVSELKGKRVGAEIGSLGMYILAQALAKEGLELNDVDILNVEQLDAEDSMKRGEIDAIVTYPPYSTAIMKHDEYHQIFDTSSIPQDIIDTISLRKSTLDTLDKEWLHRFYTAWDQALAYSQKNPEDAYHIMATREGISVDEFKDPLTGLQLLTSQQSQKALTSKQTQSNVSKVCETLAHAKSISFDCAATIPLVLLAN
jgi:NitT/TauT family transport system substrate-binding protein